MSGEKHFIVNYKNGILNGKFIEWYKNSQMKTQGYYKNNKLFVSLQCGSRARGDLCAIACGPARGNSS